MSEDERKSPRVRRWLDRLAETEHDRSIWFSASFAETIIVPIPIELILIPYMAVNRDRLWRTAAIVTAGCIVAALVGYGIGLLFFETAGRWIIEQFGWQDMMARFRDMFGQYGFFAILAIGVTPIPFQVAMLAAGAAAYSLPLFVLAAGLARGARYFGIAALVHWMGDAAEAFIKRHKRSATIVLSLLACLALGWFAWSFVSI